MIYICIHGLCNAWPLNIYWICHHRPVSGSREQTRLNDCNMQLPLWFTSPLKTVPHKLLVQREWCCTSLLRDGETCKTLEWRYIFACNSVNEPAYPEFLPPHRPVVQFSSTVQGRRWETIQRPWKKRRGFPYASRMLKLSKGSITVFGMECRDE